MGVTCFYFACRLASDGRQTRAGCLKTGQAGSKQKGLGERLWLKAHQGGLDELSGARCGHCKMSTANKKITTICILLFVCIILFCLLSILLLLIFNKISFLTASEYLIHPVISSLVREHPLQNPLSKSISHTEVQGDSTINKIF